MTMTGPRVPSSRREIAFAVLAALLYVALVLAQCDTAAEASTARACGRWHTHVTVPGSAILRADRLRAQGGASCRTSQRIVRERSYGRR